MRPVAPGSICDCVRGNGSFLVYVLSISGKNASCLSEADAKTHTLNLHWLDNPADRIDLMKRGVDEKREALKAVSARRRALRDGIDLESIWGLLVEDSDAIRGVEELSGLFFPGATGPDEISAMRSALLADRLFFEQKGDGFRPNPPEKVASIRDAGRREEARIARIEACAAACAAGAADRAAFGDLLDALRAHFLRMPEKPSPDVRELLSRLKVNPASEPELHRALVRAGVLDPLHNYHLERYGLVKGHSREALAASAALVASGIPPGPRRDLTAWPAVAIDERTTVSYDDAFHLEPEEAPGRRALCIHIAGAAGVIPEEGPLFSAALSRATSVFFPGEKYEMFPDDLANDMLSLVAGKVRPALTARFTVEGDAVTGAEFFESLIRVAENLDYSAVDRGEFGALPAADHAFLESFTAACRARRVAAGALSLDRQELLIDVEGGEIRLSLTDRGGSRVLVEELMILANEAFAGFLARSNIPAVYRYQGPMRPGPEPPCDHPAVVLHHLRRRMAPSDTGLAPRPHSGLGLSAYVQATSPIRRFGDLLVQMQMIRHLRGMPTLPAERVEDLLFRAASGARDAQAAERDRRRFLVLTHAERNPDARYEATVVEVGRAAVVHVPLLDLSAECTDLPKDPASLGRTVGVRVARVTPAAGEIRFALAR